MSEYQRIYFNCDSCNQKLCQSQRDFILAKDLNNNCYVNINGSAFCQTCSVVSNGKFKSTPFCLFVELWDEFGAEKITLKDIPTSLLINDLTFNFLCLTFFESAHFRSIFKLNSLFYLVDDLDYSNVSKKIPKNLNIKTLFYYLA